MEQLIHLPFLHALGYAIINSFWQFALLWLLYVLVNTVFKLSSHHKYVTGLLLQTVGFAWFLVTLAFYFRQCVEIEGRFVMLQEQYNVSLFTPENATLKENFLGWIMQTERILPYLSVAYLTLLVFLSFKWLRAYKYAQAVKVSCLKKIDVDWRLFVQRIAFQLGIKKTVAIYLSEMVKTPLTIGFLKPVILIPLASLNHLSTEQMEAIIIHELAHIKRLDYLFNLFLALVEAAMFFNPFMQLISRHIKRERENCCDDWVLQYEYNAATYARALLQIASLQTPGPTLALNATDNKQILLGRIKRIIEKKEKNAFNYRYQVFALLAMTFVFSTLAVLSTEKNKRGLTGQKRAVEAVYIHPLAVSIDNPLFNPVFFLAKDDRHETIEKLQPDNKNLKAIASVTSLPSLCTEMPEVGETLQPVSPEPLLVAPNSLAATETEQKAQHVEMYFDKARKVAPFIVNSFSDQADLPEPNIKVFTRIRTVKQPKDELEKQNDARAIKLAFQKINSAKKRLEMSLSAILSKQSRLSNMNTNVNFDFKLSDTTNQEALLSVELKLEQLNKKLEELTQQSITDAAATPSCINTAEVENIVRYASELKVNKIQEAFETKNVSPAEDPEVLEYYKPAVKEPAPVKVTKKGKVIRVIRI